MNIQEGKGYNEQFISLVGGSVCLQLSVCENHFIISQQKHMKLIIHYTMPQYSKTCLTDYPLMQVINDLR